MRISICAKPCRAKWPVLKHTSELIINHSFYITPTIYLTKKKDNKETVAFKYWISSPIEMFPMSNPPPLYLISGLSKSHLCILIIKHSVELSHKYITQNPLGSSRNVHSHHGEQTSSPRLNHKILSWDTPRLAINGKVEVGESRQLGAINGVLTQQVGLGTN